MSKDREGCFTSRPKQAVAVFDLQSQSQRPKTVSKSKSKVNIKKGGRKQLTIQAAFSCNSEHSTSSPSLERARFVLNKLYKYMGLIRHNMINNKV